MSTIRLKQSHRQPTSELRARAENVARRIAERHAVSWRWDGDALELVAPSGMASGTRGRVTIGEADVAIEVELPLLLRPMRRLVERQLVARVSALLAG